MTSPAVCAVVFVQRDFSQGTTPKFCTALPQELVGKISSDVFANAIAQINDLFEKAETPSTKLYFTNILSCLTGHLLQLCIENPYEQTFRDVSQLAERLDREVFSIRGLRLVDPLRRGLRAVEIQVLNHSV
eukprot:m.28114 g.28114  ORF g.28114 m.28114 type:complete len:131 (+) comp10384_c0_seq2:218-610(+)